MNPFAKATPGRRRTHVNEQEHNRASFEHQRIPLWGIKLTSARPTRGVSLRRSIVCRQQMC